MYVIAQGLHYEGPDDPRFDRFARALAAAGFRVHAPKLSDYLALRVAEGAARELGDATVAACDEAAKDGLPPPALFSISFGSMPAIAVAARTDVGPRLGGLVIFGGYCDFGAAIGFALTGRTEAGAARPFDPSNAPVVHMHLAGDEPDDRALVEAWRRFVHATWGRPERHDARRGEAARTIADALPAALRDRFLDGCGLAGDPARHLPRARQAAARMTFADPRPLLPRVAPAVVIVHGRDDDVIPFEESGRIAEALAPGHPRRVILTGLYGHTAALLPRPADAAREGAAMLDLLRAMVLAPLGDGRLERFCRR